VRRKNSGGRSKAIQFREWRVVLIRNRGQLLGWVNTPDPVAAEIEATKRFELNNWQRYEHGPFAPAGAAKRGA
jgi:hypothetical protein